MSAPALASQTWGFWGGRGHPLFRYVHSDGPQGSAIDGGPVLRRDGYRADRQLAVAISIESRRHLRARDGRMVVLWLSERPLRTASASWRKCRPSRGSGFCVLRERELDTDRHLRDRCDCSSARGATPWSSNASYCQRTANGRGRSGIATPNSLDVTQLGALVSNSRRIRNVSMVQSKGGTGAPHGDSLGPLRDELDEMLASLPSVCGSAIPMIA